MPALDILLFAIIAWLCWQGYQKRRLWFAIPITLWLKFASDRCFLQQFLIFAPATVCWLLLCHWIDTHGWHATAAGCMLFAMTIGLEAMRMTEEEQKWTMEQCDMELKP